MLLYLMKTKTTMLGHLLWMLLCMSDDLKNTVVTHMISAIEKKKKVKEYKTGRLTK